MRIKQIVTRLLMALLLYGPVQTFAQSGAAPSSHLYYSGGNTSSDIWMNSVLVPITTTYTYYSVMGWNTGQEGGGYCGIQDHPNGRVFIFSLWDPSNRLPIVGVHKGPGTQIENFGGEGTGLKSWNFTLGWETNKWYNLVTRVWQYNGHTYFGFWSQDISSGKWTHLVTMDYPVANVTFKGNNDAFIEDWIGTGANVRKVLFKDAWQRSTTGTWKLQKAATFSSNSGDAYRNGVYNDAFNAGIENGSFFMQIGGNTTHSFPGRTTSLSINSNATTPTTTIGEISSYTASYNSSTKYANVIWEVNQFKSPQYSYTFEVFNNAQYTGSPLITVTDNVPHARSLSANLSSLSNGVYYTRFKIKDIFDNISVAKTSVITIGGGPSVTITSPSNNAVLDLPVSTLIKANASSTNGSITKVEFYEGNTKLGEDLSAPYEILWNTNNKGSYKISVVAYDSQGNSTSAEINLSADFNCNVLTGTAFGTSPAYVNGSSTYDKVFDGNINTFFDYAQANGGYAGLDLGSAKVIRGIRFYPRSGWSARMTGGKLQASNSADFSTGVVTLYTITSQPSGSWHEVVVNNSNAYRYVRYLSPDGGYCNVAEVQFCGTTSTNQIPSVSITQPVNGASYTAPASITIQANASDADGTISKVEFYNGNTLLGSDNTSPYSYTWTGVANGNYTITAKAYDNSGAVATSAAINVSVTTPNSCNLLSGTAFGTSPAYNNGTSTYDKVFDGNINTFFDYAVAANGYAGLDFGAGKGAIINTIRFYPRATWPGRMVGGKFQGSNVADFSSGVVDLYTINTTPSVAWTEVTINSNQAFRYVRYLSPANGYCNIAEAQFCGTITSQNALPTVAITSPANNAAFTAPASITINATASDADGTISKVEFYNGNTLLTTDYTSPYSYTWSSVAPGNYTLTAKAYDNSGAVNTSSAVTITVNSSNTGTEACSNIPEWNSSSIYVANDQVVYSGFKYKANWWTKGNNPATNSGPYQVWTKIGECASGGAFRLFIASINETIQVIPNPNNARFHIAAPTGVSLIGANVELLTMAGHKVYESTILSENEEIIPEELNIGMYLLKLTIGEKAYFTRVEIVK